MTKYYAKLALDGSIESVLESDEETVTETLIELVEQPDWASRPSRCHKPFCQDGKMVWIAKAEDIRQFRNELLAQSDWTQLPDIAPEIAQKWVIYRQNLRDIPQQTGYPSNVIWPNPPQ